MPDNVMQNLTLTHKYPFKLNLFEWQLYTYYYRSLLYIKYKKKKTNHDLRPIISKLNTFWVIMKAQILVGLLESTQKCTSGNINENYLNCSKKYMVMICTGWHFASQLWEKIRSLLPLVLIILEFIWI